MFCGRIVAEPQSYRFDRRPLCSIRGMSVPPRGLRIGMSHQIGNRRFAATRFRKSGPEGVTQIVPMQIVDSSQLTSRCERLLNVSIRLDGIRIEEDVSVTTNSAAYLPQRVLPLAHSQPIVSNVISSIRFQQIVDRKVLLLMHRSFAYTDTLTLSGVGSV